MKCCVEGCTREVMRRSRLKRCELHTLEHKKAKAQEYEKKQWQRAKAARSHPCICGCGRILTGRKLLAEGCQPARHNKSQAKPHKARPCRCGCGVTVYGAFQYASDECREKMPRKRHLITRDSEVEAATKEYAEIKAASKPLPRVTLSDEERDALDRAKRKSDEAAEKELAARREKLDPRLLIARRFVGVIAPYETGFAPNRATEYQPPQRARIFASDAASTWEG